MSIQRNVFGEPMRICSKKPMTGYFRNGCCETDGEDAGEHTACVEVTDEFLKFSKSKGNDLTTPAPHFGFPGLVAGDRWCVCAGRWKEAHEAGKAAKLVLEACHESLLDYCDLEELKKFAV